MNVKQVLFTFLGFSLFFSCQQTSEDLEINSVINKTVFSGYVQKGPFVNGSSVTIIELDEKLNQTGRTYSTTVSDNLGRFEHKNFQLISNYAILKAEGYYFNEVSGKTSSGQVTLYALVDIKDVNLANVNVLTHLTRARIEYLVQQESFNFSKAKQQAQKEVMAIFGISIPESAAFESLNLIDDAALLAISSILQGSLSTGDMAALMADIITDIRSDGVLNNTTLTAKLVNNAETFLPSTVRNNLISKYTELGINVTIPEFKNNVQSFIDGKVDPNTRITYPETGTYGINILSDAVTSAKEVDHTNNTPLYSLRADIPLGRSLKIVVKDGNRIGGSGSLWIWALLPEQTNWNIGLHDQNLFSREFK